MKKIIKLIILIIILLLPVLLYFNKYNFSLGERQARKTVEGYLNSIKTGKGDPYLWFGYTIPDKGIFINVIDYNHLTTVKKKIFREPYVYDREDYEKSIYMKELYPSFEEYLNGVLKTFGEKAKRVGDTVVLASDEYHNEYELLYDVTITNRLGMKLYKKYVFTVEPSILNKETGYRIRSHDER